MGRALAITGIDDPPVQVPCALGRDAAASLVLKLLADLNDELEWQAVWLYHVEGVHTVEQIAGRLHQPPPLITQRLEHFRANVKRELLLRLVDGARPR